MPAPPTGIAGFRSRLTQHRIGVSGASSVNELQLDLAFDRFHP